MKTEFDLMTHVARKLSGKNLRVRLKIPAGVGCAGECHADESGRTVIDIHPYLNDDDMLYVLAHEIAHAKLHKFYPSDVHTKPSGSLELEKKTDAYLKREDDADELAHRWVNYAKSKADDFEDWLWALVERYG